MGNYRLSPQQKHLWLQKSGDENRSPYRVQCEVLIEGNIDDKRLKKALETIVGRHEILRTVFQTPSGVTIPVQSVRENLEALLSEKISAICQRASRRRRLIIFLRKQKSILSTSKTAF